MNKRDLWGIFMTIVTAILLGVVISTPDFMSSKGVEFIADHIVDEPIKEKLDQEYVASAFMEMQIHNNQIRELDKEILYLEREAIRPDTTPQQRMLYETQKSRMEKEKAAVEREFKSRPR